MKLHDIIERLTFLGLDPEEATLYVHLSMLGASKASDVASAAKLQRTETYRVLQSLVSRGFVTATLTRPTRYEALAPETLFQEILDRERARQAGIERAKAEIGSALSTLRAESEAGPSRNTFKILQGRRETFAVVERFLREAKAEVRIFSTHPGEAALGDRLGLWAIAEARARDGVRFRAILREGGEGALPKEIEVRRLATPRIARYVVADDAEVAFWVASDPHVRLVSDEDVALVSKASDLVSAQALLFDVAWDGL